MPLSRARAASLRAARGAVASHSTPSRPSSSSLAASRALAASWTSHRRVTRDAAASDAARRRLWSSSSASSAADPNETTRGMITYGVERWRRGARDRARREDALKRRRRTN